MNKYKRTLSELKKQAVLYWPDEILTAASELSVLPLLLKTQDSFISLLKVANKCPESWRLALNQNASLSGPLFLKHLMVMADLGGEALNKLTPLSNYCPNGILKFDWEGEIHEYRFFQIQEKCSLANSALKVDSRRILEGGELTEKMIDVAMLLIFGSSSINDSLPIEVKDRCIIGTLIGFPEKIDRFTKENYIRVSRQIGGATANALGQIAQNYVINHLKSSLPSDWVITRDSTLPNVSHTNDSRGTNFDVVVKSPNDEYFGVEISFQVTTNSVIERKAHESESLLTSVHSAGHKICYVIDGAGNINIRKNAVEIICKNSDCTVAMAVNEIKHMADFMIKI